MTTRDRLMLIGIVALAVLLGAWFTVVAPKREQASKVNAEVEAARQQVSSAETEADSAASSRAQYSTAYASLVSLGQAVPSTPETPALIYALDKATHRRDVQFSSISTGASGSSGSSSDASATPAAAAGGEFTQEPFTFVFNGTFVGLYKLLNQLEGFTLQTPSGALHVSGRLLTIDSVSLSPVTEVQSASGKPKSGQLTGTITATAYVLPASQSALAGATAAGPSATTAASSPSTTAAPATAPAVIKANP
ncbi:MAG: type II secretion system protein GspM [Solirubrobacteraceae bacterium]